MLPEERSGAPNVGSQVNLCKHPTEIVEKYKVLLT